MSDEDNGVRVVGDTLSNGTVGEVCGVELRSPFYPFNQRLFNGGKVYYPRSGEPVVGVVTQSFGDGYTVDINSTFLGYLPAQAFNGATKTNRPKLQVGTAVFCRVSWAGEPTQRVVKKLSDGKNVSATKKSEVDVGPLNLNDSCELTCLMPEDQRKWTSNELVLGAVPVGGYFFEIPLTYGLALQHPDNFLLELIGQKIRFECAIGSNGRVWVLAGTAGATATVAKAISDGQRCKSYESQIKFVERLFPAADV